MKARFKYLIYPTPGQRHRLAKLFGCVCWHNATRTCCLE
nr:helix-turn-helix domain-containing protein [Okeania sp. SIO2F4]